MIYSVLWDQLYFMTNCYHLATCLKTGCGILHQCRWGCKSVNRKISSKHEMSIDIWCQECKIMFTMAQMWYSLCMYNYVMMSPIWQVWHHIDTVATNIIISTHFTYRSKIIEVPELSLHLYNVYWSGMTYSDVISVCDECLWWVSVMSVCDECLWWVYVMSVCVFCCSSALRVLLEVFFPNSLSHIPSRE